MIKLNNQVKQPEDPEDRFSKFLPQAKQAPQALPQMDMKMQQGSQLPGAQIGQTPNPKQLQPLRSTLPQAPVQPQNSQAYQADPNAFYGVKASGQRGGQSGPSGFVSFDRTYAANKGAIDSRNAQINDYLNSLGNQARRSADMAGQTAQRYGVGLDALDVQGGRGPNDVGYEDAAMDRSAAMRALGLMTDEYGRGALAEAALDAPLSDFDRMLMGAGGNFGQAQGNLQEAGGRLEGNVAMSQKYAQEQAAKRAERDAMARRIAEDDALIRAEEDRVRAEQERLARAYKESSENRRAREAKSAKTARQNRDENLSYNSGKLAATDRPEIADAWRADGMPDDYLAWLESRPDLKARSVHR